MKLETNKRTALAAAVLVSLLFTLLIAWLSPLLGRFVIGPDQGPSWYYWQLASPTLLSRLSAWIPYVLHQLTVWILGFLIVRRIKAGKSPFPGLTLAALGLNAFFIGIHILQSHLFFDGIAQDVPVWSSQFSVIVMLVIILYQMAPRRGLFLGIGKFNDAAGQKWTRSWHGIYISWALVYTFWFHPTVGDFGLLTGFFYMFLLLTQASFAGTPVHLKAGWIALLELGVAFHGPAIAIQKMISGNEGDNVFEPGMWIMFTSGFLFMFVFTGQYSWKMPRWGRAIVFAGYGALIAVLYSWWGWNRLYTVAFIPVALYGGALALALVAKLAGMVRRKK